MSGCWSEGELRAWLDGELAEPDAGAMEQHLAGCGDCTARLRILEARAERVGMLMGSLAEPAGQVATARMPPVVIARRNWRWTGIPAAIAAGVTVAFLLAPTRHTPMEKPALKGPEVPVVEPHRTAGPAAEQRAQVAQTRPRKAASEKSAKRENGDYYLALDDEPIDTGVVVRVALDDNSQADVILDSQGRARAIRPVKQNGPGER